MMTKELLLFVSLRREASGNSHTNAHANLRLTQYLEELLEYHVIICSTIIHKA
jgi:hypothetical protein